MNHKTQIAVIGGGHAGCEAALAAARLGLDTTLFTLSLDAVANMPCNPSIGGTAKGHLVYEIDAIGGEMGRQADRVTLQSRTLNLGKGAAVRSKRIQADRRAYSDNMKHVLETTENLHPLQAEVISLGVTVDPDGKTRVSSVTTRLGEVYECKAAIICSGTYLDSRIFVGDVNYPAGPDGLLPSKGLSRSLSELGITIRRFKTGTPCRVLRSSIDFDRLELQPGEDDPIPYSHRTPRDGEKKPPIPCHIVYTNAETHRIIRENIGRSALYSGQIHGTGPRYCPSIEDKLVRFADKERHQLFVEPMGESTEEMYIQGFSTSLPPDIQDAMMRSLDGFETAVITRYAYAIEYDCTDPTELLPTLEFKNVSNLYGAGQFNGTSGYEEAAAQGLIAGINAALKLKGEEPLFLSRSDGYIGTLIDDLVTKGTNEPYRMMTSRSEYRLLLRQDNADARLTPLGYRVGLIDEARYVSFETKQRLIEDEKRRLETTFLSPSELNPFLTEHEMSEVSGGLSLADLIRRPQISYDDLTPIDRERPDGISPEAVLTVECDIKYAGYIKKQLSEVKKHEKLEKMQLPSDIDYNSIPGLRLEAAQKLSAIRPMTVGQASRISGVSPADISVLIIRLGMK